MQMQIILNVIFTRVWQAGYESGEGAVRPQPVPEQVETVAFLTVVEWWLDFAVS